MKPHLAAQRSRPLTARAQVRGEQWTATAVSMGNPHCVIFSAPAPDPVSPSLMPPAFIACARRAFDAPPCPPLTLSRPHPRPNPAPSAALTQSTPSHPFSPLPMPPASPDGAPLDVNALDLAAIGPAFENNPAFPKRTNTEFVQARASSQTQEM